MESPRSETMMGSGSLPVFGEPRSVKQYRHRCNLKHLHCSNAFEGTKSLLLFCLFLQSPQDEDFFHLRCCPLCRRHRCVEMTSDFLSAEEVTAINQEKKIPPGARFGQTLLPKDVLARLPRGGAVETDEGLSVTVQVITQTTEPHQDSQETMGFPSSPEVLSSLLETSCTRPLSTVVPFTWLGPSTFPP